MAKEKKSFVLRMNCETMSALEKWAADEFRSVNGQLEYIITDAGISALNEELIRLHELLENGKRIIGGAE